MKYLCYKFFSFTCRGACSELFRGFNTSRAILFQTSARKGVEQSEGIQFISVPCISVSIWIIGMGLHSTLASIVGVIIFPYRLGVLPYQFMVFLFGGSPTEYQNFLCMLRYGCIMLNCFIHSDSPVGCDGIFSYL